MASRSFYKKTPINHVPGSEIWTSALPGRYVTSSMTPVSPFMQAVSNYSSSINAQ